ncbi:hypothetical protein ABE426_14445 [Sphingobacterium faecium]|uniref:hypothetical protein n=1 Tax=Sphingobacterium faecium TaxID=34087 RepID=UPI00320B3A6A
MLTKIYELLKEACACDWALEELKRITTIGELIQLLKSPKGIEFCMENNFMSQELFDQYRIELEKEGVFFDGQHKLQNPRLVIAFGGQIDIDMDGFQVCELYGKNNANISVYARDNAYVSAEIHGEATLNSAVSDEAIIKKFKR